MDTTDNMPGMKAMYDYDKILSNMVIDIRGVRLADPAMLGAILQRVAYYHDTAKEITITCTEPDRDGSTMYILQVTYRSGGGITIGALRRAPGAEIEFHS